MPSRKIARKSRSGRPPGAKTRTTKRPEAAAAQPIPPAPVQESPDEAARRRILAVGVDPALVDWRRVAAGIAVDEGAPATARVAACRLLATTGVGAPTGPADDLRSADLDEDATDELSRRALAIMSARGGVQ